MGHFGKAWTEDELKKKGIKIGLQAKDNLIPDNDTENENKRVKNAKKTIIDGIAFDSKLEGMMYLSLKNLSIPHERQHKIILQPRFRYNGKMIRAITWTVDFYFPWCELLLDTKGYATEIAKMKMKMFKYNNSEFGADRKMYKDLIIVKNQKDVEPQALKLLELWQIKKQNVS